VQVVMPQNWLFLASYEKQRESLAQAGSGGTCWDDWDQGAFETISGEVVQAILLTQTCTNRRQRDFSYAASMLSAPR
jgi:hypothetical protein